MAKRQLKECVQIGLKLGALYEACGGRLRTDVPMRNDKDLIAYWNTQRENTDPADTGSHETVASSTLNAWRIGDTSKGRPPSMVQPKHLWRLADLLREVTGDHLSRDDAYAAWASAEITDFRRILTGPIGSKLERLLKTRPAELLTWVEPSETSFFMVNRPLTPLPGEVELKPKQLFQLAVEKHRSQFAVIIIETPEGWQWLEPGGGMMVALRHKTALIPPEPGYDIESPPGHYRFIVIEMKSSPPPVAEGSTLDFTAEREASLVADLNDFERAGAWRWGECRALVKRTAKLSQERSAAT